MHPDISILARLSSEAIKELITTEREKVKFLESFIFPISTGVLAIAVTDELELFSNHLQYILILVGLNIIIVLQWLRQLSLNKIKIYIQFLIGPILDIIIQKKTIMHEKAIAAKSVGAENLEQGKQEIELLNTANGKALRKINWEMWGVIVGIIGLILGQCNLSNKVEKVESDVGNVKLQRQFIVTSPSDSGNVILNDIISGITPFPELNHYIVVTPVKVGDHWVQDNPVKVDSSGRWTGRAIFGAPEIGASEKYIVRCLATKDIMPAGRLTAVPKDAVFSDPIIVTRKK